MKRTQIQLPDELYQRAKAFAAQRELSLAEVNQWPNLQTYLSDGRVEIDNNLVENAIRPTKLGAKNWLFIGAEQAGEKSAVIYTLVENCRRLGLDAREYFEDVLTRLPSMKASEAVGLTPANWHKAKKTRSGTNTHVAA